MIATLRIAARVDLFYQMFMSLDQSLRVFHSNSTAREKSWSQFVYLASARVKVKVSDVKLTIA